jgi:phytoene dehydrogenase-like protein
MTSYDGIVIGAGHNGLAVAGLLAKAGRKVLVVESRDVVGGIAAGEEFHPGYRTTGLVHDTTCVWPDVIKSLGLANHGLQLREAPAPVFVPTEQVDGGLLLHHDPEKAHGEIARVSAIDAEAYRRFRQFLAKVAPVMRRVVTTAAPDPAAGRKGGLLRLAGTGLSMRKLGPEAMMEMLRIAPMALGDFLREWFSSEALKAALAGPAIEGTWLGPWSPGGVATMILRAAMAGPGVVGGPAALIRALHQAATSHGVDVRLGSPVTRIRVNEGRARGVTLETGEEIDAPWVISTCDPRRTMFGLIEPRQLPVEIADDIRILRMRGTTAKVNLALNAPLRLAMRPDELFSHIQIGDEIDGLERAFDAVKYGEFSSAPLLDIRVPTVEDPTLAPDGHHVVSVLFHFAPYDLRAGWTDETRSALGDTVVDSLARHAPALRDHIVARQVLTPVDLEAHYGLTGGHIHHGEMALDQLLFLRPGPSCAWYTTPIEGLALGGSGSHPGGGLTCGPAALCAAEILHQ